MKRLAIAAILAACSLAGTGCAPVHYGHVTRERSRATDSLAVMTMQDVIALSKAGVGDDVILNLIDVSGTDFRLSTRDVIELADSGVADKVIGAMIKTDDPTRYAIDSERYYASPPYYWYAAFQWWDPTFFVGVWPVSYAPFFYRPLYGLRYSPSYGPRSHLGPFHAHASGGYRSGGGRHR